MSGIARWIPNPFRRRRTTAPSKPKPISRTVRDWFSSSYYQAEYKSSFAVNLANVKKVFTERIEIYKRVEAQTFVPAEVVCAIHSMEGSLQFHTVLHNGEHLATVDRRGTRLVPKDRGKGLNWTWEDAAVDALMMKKHIFPTEWTVSATLDFLERYNGLGYRKYHKTVNTPYLWSGTQFYSKGKYVSDGKWSDTAVSKQVGCVPILRTLGYAGE